MNEITKETMLKMAKDDLRQFACDDEELGMWYEKFCRVCDEGWKIHRFWLIFDEVMDVEYILSRFECGSFGFIDEDEDGLVSL